MTNRQSNIIFYSVISLIIFAVILNYTNPEFFEDLTKSKKEISIEEAIDKGEYKAALNIYQQLADGKIRDNDENTIETATIYQDIANLYSLLGNKDEEINYYLKALNIKKQLTEVDVYGIVRIYDKLGSLAEEDKQFDQAQMYYEKSLEGKLGTAREEDDGLFVGMMNTRTKYLRLNNEETIATFKKLGEIHNIKAEYSIAKKYYEKALAASKLTFGEDDVKTLEIMNLMNTSDGLSLD